MRQKKQCGQEGELLLPPCMMAVAIDQMIGMITVIGDIDGQSCREAGKRMLLLLLIGCV